MIIPTLFFSPPLNTLIFLYTSKDGKTWSRRQRCTSPWLTWNGGYLPWHLEARPNYREQRIEFMINGWPRYNSKAGMSLFYAEVDMDNLTTFKMPLSSLILSKSPGNSWDSKLIYRTTFTLELSQGAYKYCVWYTGQSISGVWHIGYTEGQLGTNYSQIGNNIVSSPAQVIPTQTSAAQIASASSSEKVLSLEEKSP